MVAIWAFFEKNKFPSESDDWPYMTRVLRKTTNLLAFKMREDNLEQIKGFLSVLCQFF